MTISLPSVHSVIADIPEIKQFSGEFRYNFFEPDERINDAGSTAPEFVKEQSAESFDAKFIQSNKFNRFTARCNILKWKPVLTTTSIVPKGINISDNFSKIYNEQDFSVEQFVPVHLQDKNINSKINFAIKKIIEFQNDQLETNPNDPSSHMDLVKKLSERTSQQISKTLLSEGLVGYEEDGYNFFKNNEKINQQSLIDDTANVKQYMQLNTRFADIILGSSSDSSFSMFDDDEVDLSNQIKSIQNNNNFSKNPNILDSKDYDFEILEYLDIRPIDTNGFEPRWQIIGYIIDKFELLDNGTTKKMESIFIENPNINTTIDYRIKYGARYQYTIRSVAYLESQAEDTETNDMVIVSYMISSKDSTILTINCEEFVPPPNPADVNTRWDYTKEQLILQWNFPPNSQRDIKQWQIFRRKNVDESFELQKIYNFDDSVVKISDDYTESPNQECIEHMTNPKCFWVDKEFTKDTKFIYALCSIDAHGHSSNYSIQIETAFDKYNNAIIKKMISPSGAPKAYPNINLFSDAFVDTIKDSNHDKMHIYFNPEYLKVLNAKGNNLNLMPKKCVFNIINIDLQEQINIDINIKELKPAKKHTHAVEIKATPKKLKL